MLRCLKSYGDTGRVFKISSLGNAIGLNRVTLKYPTAGEEDGYLHHCYRKLLKVWPPILITYAFFTMALIVGSIHNFGWPWQQNSERLSVEMILFGFRLGGAVQALLHIIASKYSKISNCIGHLTMERSVIFLCLFSSVSCLGRFYIAKMLGHSDPYELFTTDELPSSYTDTLFVLQLFTVLMISHVCPVRWCSLLVIEVATPVIYIVPICLSWSPEPKKWTCFLQMVLLVFLSSYGKRQMEVNDRLVFSSLLNEKILRMKAEFELSQQQNNKDSAHSERSASIPETATTGEAFMGLDAEEILPLSLQAVFNIGKREQWLINEKELAVDPEVCLGIGGFGIVLAGEFNASPAALKIHKWTGMNRSLFAIGNELRLLRKLRHPNIVLFHGACLNLVQNDLVLVMERVIGKSMTLFMNDKPSSPELIQALTGICHGLVYLHTRHPAITHGDLKPSNIMIEQRGSQPHAKILDFGLARLITLKARPGGGTLRWLAPEMMKTKTRPSVSSDVFALGLIIYFASTGKTPFEELSIKSFKAHARASIEMSSALRWPLVSTEFSANCKPIVELATLRLPQDRPSVQDVLSMISEIGRSDLSRSKVGRCASDLWGSLILARQISTKSQRLKFRSWLEKVKFVEQLAKPSITPVREEEEEEEVQHELGNPSSSRSSLQSDELFYPGFALTPMAFKKVSIFETFMSWNCILPSDTCCEYHALLAQLLSVHQELQAYACKRIKKPGSTFEQCPVCSLVTPRDAEADSIDEEMNCKLCGYLGPPRQCEESSTANNQVAATQQPQHPMSISL